jgi:hypothetical protein
LVPRAVLWVVQLLLVHVVLVLRVDAGQQLVLAWQLALVLPQAWPVPYSPPRYHLQTHRFLPHPQIPDLRPSLHPM